MSHTPWLERTHKNHPADSGNWLEIGVWEDAAQLRAGWVSGAPGPHPGVRGRCDFTLYLCEETEPKAQEGWDRSVLTSLRALWSVWWVQNWGWGKDSDEWVWHSPYPGVRAHCYSLWTLLNVIEESFECQIKRGELKCVTAEDKQTQRELCHTLGQNPWAFYQVSPLWLN